MTNKANKANMAESGMNVAGKKAGEDMPAPPRSGKRSKRAARVQHVQHVQHVQRMQREQAPWVVPVLIAEHDEENRQTMTAALAAAGYAVQQVTEGVAALQFLLTARPPLVVVAEEDLPELGGFQIARLLSLKPAPASRYSAIVLTGSLRAALRQPIQSRLDAITLEVLVKPFPISELLLAVEMAAGRLVEHRRKPRDTDTPDTDTSNTRAEA